MNYPSVRDDSSSLSHPFGDGQNQIQMKQLIEILVVPDDVYGDVWVILVSAIHVGVLEMS